MHTKMVTGLGLSRNSKSYPLPFPDATEAQKARIRDLALPADAVFAALSHACRGFPRTRFIHLRLHGMVAKTV